MVGEERGCLPFIISIVVVIMIIIVIIFIIIIIIISLLCEMVFAIDIIFLSFTISLQYLLLIMT